MSAETLQQALVLLYFHPPHLDGFLSDTHYLPDLKLAALERAWIRKIDRRALAADGTRVARALLAIRQELPMTFALLEQLNLSQLPAEYFGSSEFLRVICERGSMALQMATYLRRRCDESSALRENVAAARELADVISLELAAMRVRRAAKVAAGFQVAQPTEALSASVTPGAEEQPLSACGVQIVTVSSDSWALFDRFCAHVSENFPGQPELAGAADISRATDGHGEAKQFVLCRMAEAKAILFEPISEHFAAFLQFAAPIQGRSRQQLVAKLVDEDLAPGEAEELIGELISDGILTPELGGS